MSSGRNRLAAVAAGATILVTFGSLSAVAANLIGSADIRNGGVHKVDIGSAAVGASEIVDGSVGENQLSAGVVEKLNNSGEPRLAGEPGVQGEQGEPGAAGAAGAPGEQGAKGDPASDVFGKLAVTKSSTAMDPIAKLGGPYAENATDLFAFELTEAGTYLVNAYGYFDRLNAEHANYETPNTDSYLQLSLRGTGVNAGTYFTGAVSRPGRIEATVSGATLVTVTAPTTITVRAFGYNDDRSGFGGTPNSATPQFSAFATVSAIRVG